MRAKGIVVALVAAVSVLGLAGVAAADVDLDIADNPDPDVGCYYDQWKLITDKPVPTFTGGRKMNNRAALQVRYSCGSGPDKPTHIRGYSAITCTYPNTSTRHACSLDHILILEEAGLELERVSQDVVTNDNGFFSEYTAWFPIRACRTYVAASLVNNPGLAGQRVGDSSSITNPGWRYCPT